MIESELAQRFVPPDDPAFFEELWIRAEQAERRAARRWRATAIAAAAAAVAATSAASVLAFSGGAAAHTVDGTFLCTSNDQGGVNEFRVGGEATGPYGWLEVETNPFVILAPNKLSQQVGYHVTEQQLRDNKLNFEPRNCSPTSRTIPLARRGLALKSTVIGSSDSVNCWVTKAYFRLRVTFDAQKRPTHSTLAMANAKTGKPLAFIEAKPPRLTTYAAAACLHD